MTPAELLAIADRPAPPVIPGQLAVPDGPAIGSLCTGYGGLDIAVQQVLGGHLAWVADPDPGATAILTHHHPDVPNLGDITVTNWATVPPVDILCGGYPCQPFSVAGLRKGTADERHIWPYIATAIRVLRPRLCLFENVAGHVRLGLADVIADLAALGFDAEWTTVRASDVGGAHQRERLFILAVPSDAPGVGRGEGRPEPAWLQGGSHAVGGRRSASDTGRAGLARRGAGRPASDSRGGTADADRGRLQGLQERHGEPQGPQVNDDHHEPDAHGRGVADADTAHDRRERGGAAR